MEVQIKRVSDLRESANPRRHPREQIDRLKSSLTEWGWTIPVLVDEGDRILAGHGRVQAAVELSFEEVPCLVAEGWSDAQKQAYVIADNRLSETSFWDMELLKSLVQQLRDAEEEAPWAALDLDIPYLQQLLRDVYDPSQQRLFGEGDIERAEQHVESYGQRGPEIQTRSINCPECGAVVSIIRDK